MNWKQKYNFAICCAVWFLFGICFCKFFIKPEIKIKLSEHCFVKDIILKPSDFNKLGEQW
jgi:hypothetical protein